MTSEAPTNIPGMGGVPGCRAILADQHSSAYCDCGGKAAPTLSPTASDFMNCAYTILPTSSYDPAFPVTTTESPPEEATSAAPAPPYATGECNVHVYQGLGQRVGDPMVVIGVDITDADGVHIGSGSSGDLDWSETADFDSKLPFKLSVTPFSRDKTLEDSSTVERRDPRGPTRQRHVWRDGPVQFTYNDQTWDTRTTCSVGGWDGGSVKENLGVLIFGDRYLLNREMDCKFQC